MYRNFISLYTSGLICVCCARDRAPAQRVATTLRKRPKHTRFFMAKPHSLKFLPGIGRIILAALVAVNRGNYRTLEIPRISLRNVRRTKYARLAKSCYSDPHSIPPSAWEYFPDYPTCPGTSVPK